MANLVNLQSFKKNNPQASDYISSLEVSLSNVITDEYSESFPKLPHPKRIVQEGLLVPPLATKDMFTKTSKLSYFINTMINICESKKASTLEMMARAVIYEYPEILDLYQNDEQIAYCAIESRLAEHMCIYNKAPVIEMTEGIAQLLSNTNINNTDTIPVGALKSRYQQCYYDFTATPKLPSINGTPIVGAYYLEDELLASEIDKDKLDWLKQDTSIMSAVNRGTLTLDEDLTFVTIVLVGYRNGIALHEGVEQTVTSYMYNSSRGDEVSISDVFYAHADGALSKEDSSNDTFDFNEMKEPLSLLFNILLYMGCTEDDREIIKDGTDLEIQIKQVKNPKKARKYIRQRGTKYDYVRIGRQYKLEGSNHSNSNSSTPRDTHFRSGHWRSQKHGKGRKLTKMIWIKPTIVGDGVSTKQKDALVQ
ncbi:hypothetical protein VCHA53O466_40445 [Vibrio chagasii]|nr:hypothetical protein VCHA53O466_40445 [Vibrio chagasii]